MLRDIKTIRNRTGLSQTQFAKKYAISAQAVRSWEQGVRNPQPSTLLMLNEIDQLESSINLMTENVAYAHLVDQFGPDDIVRNYTSEYYPDSCTFYIKSRDMYIELFDAWQHGEHWFSDKSEQDRAILEEWQTNGILNPICDVAAQIWSEQDVKKQNTARKNRLNYVVFRKKDIRDFFDWMNAGCPDGTDYDGQNTWYANIKQPKKHISKCLETTAPDGFSFESSARPDTGALTESQAIHAACAYESENEPFVTTALMRKFGPENVIRSYTCPEYPFPHIYIKSRDLHIDILDHIAHGRHWFNKNSEKDMRQLKSMITLEHANPATPAMSYEWGLTDTLRRWYAGTNKLNYVTFWKPNMADFKKWLDAGCPDGYDWYIENSWLK